MSQTDVSSHSPPPFPSTSWAQLSSGLASFTSTAVSIVHRPLQLQDLLFQVLELSSLWRSTLPGPNYVSPSASLTKRRSGRLARLLLQHTRRVAHQQATTVTPASQTHYVAVIDLQADNTTHPAFAYSHGFFITWLLLDVFVLLPFFYQTHNWSLFFLSTPFICNFQVFMATLPLSLVTRSGAPVTHSGSARECTLLLDDDIFVVLNGPHRLVEAILEGRVEHPFPNERVGIDYLRYIREGFFRGLLRWNGLIISIFLLNLTPLGLLAILLAVPVTLHFFMGLLLPRNTSLFTRLSSVVGDLCALLIIIGIRDSVITSALTFMLLFVAGMPLMNGRNYPVQSEKLLALLGNPLVRTWQFQNEAATTTFLGLLLCRGFPRPVKEIDVAGVMELLIPDQRPVWNAWKHRVGDRITHELEDILFTPTIPAFPDSRQERLKRHLDEAQLAYDTFISAFPPDTTHPHTH